MGWAVIFPASAAAAAGAWTDVAASRAVDGTTYTNTDGKDRHFSLKLSWGWTGVASGGGVELDGVNVWAPAGGASETMTLSGTLRNGGTLRINPGSPAWSITKSKWAERAA